MSTTALNSEKKKTLVPQLRFQEFDGQWENKKLSDVTSYVDYRGRAPIKTDNGHFLVTAKNIKKGFIDYECSKEYVAENDYSNVMSKGLPEIGDIVFTTEAPLGNVALVDRANIALAQRVIKFRGKKMLSNFYLLHYMLSNIFQNDISKKAIGTTVQGISGKELHRIKISIPTIPEQQKIASFLSAVDEKIQQFSRKKELLEQYKKGVMQQLFSGKLRFKDENGKDYADWEEKKLGEVSIFLDGKRKPIKSEDRAKMKGIYPYYGASGIIDYVNDFIFDDEIILLGEDGENIVSRNLPLAFRVSGKCWINNHAHVIKPINNNNIDFLTYSLERINYVIYNTGTAQPKLNQEVCRNIPLSIPSISEQQKIAKFLSSIDVKIESTNNQIIKMQSFKKGLLQQMFV